MAARDSLMRFRGAALPGRGWQEIPEKPRRCRAGQVRPADRKIQKTHKNPLVFDLAEFVKRATKEAKANNGSPLLTEGCPLFS
jgi:hypothetical protein